MEAAEFGKNMNAMGEMIETFGIEVGIADFPRLRTQREYEPDQESATLGTHLEKTKDKNEGDQRIGEEEWST